MIETSKHLLKKPEVTDDVIDTINHLGENFQKIDDLIDNETMTLEYFLTEGVSYPRGMRLWNLTPLIGEYAGWINVQEGTYAPEWEDNTEYSVGDLRMPTTHNGHVYECIESGTSVLNEPMFPVTSGATVLDMRDVQEWIADYAYNVGDIVVPAGESNPYYYYRCTTAGVSGSDSPTWSQTSTTEVVDGSVQWRTYKMVRWQESGDASNFRRFGKIE